MTQSIQHLITEREQLKARLNWLGLRSDGSEKIERRIREIDIVLELKKNEAV